jgi:hypothetical protein
MWRPTAVKNIRKWSVFRVYPVFHLAYFFKAPADTPLTTIATADTKQIDNNWGNGGMSPRISSSIIS